MILLPTPFGIGAMTQIAANGNIPKFLDGSVRMCGMTKVYTVDELREIVRRLEVAVEADQKADMSYWHNLDRYEYVKRSLAWWKRKLAKAEAEHD
jgi:hypothetical protein